MRIELNANQNTRAHIRTFSAECFLSTWANNLRALKALMRARPGIKIIICRGGELASGAHTAHKLILRLESCERESVRFVLRVRNLMVPMRQIIVISACRRKSVIMDYLYPRPKSSRSHHRVSDSLKENRSRSTIFHRRFGKNPFG